jgi:thiol-disulfide isomerase/thioredoxin
MAGITSLAWGQQRVEGVVVDGETGRPVPFASVGVVGTSRGTSTNLQGAFSIVLPPDATVKISSVGYESAVITSLPLLARVELKPVATELEEVIIFQGRVNARSVVRRAFARIRSNYNPRPFLQNFFYRHYNKDDNVYGRLIEASVDVWKEQGYRATQPAAGLRDAIRVNHLRRSLDKTVMAQGHEPIAIRHALQADIAGYQAPAPGNHRPFFSDVSNLQPDLADFNFLFEGLSTYDDQTVYKIAYIYKIDSVLTTQGFQLLPVINGTLFITTDTYAIVKATEERSDGPNAIRSTALYRKIDRYYYPYHFIREGTYRTSDRSVHAFRIELMSVEVRFGEGHRFTGSEPDKEALLEIPYDSLFWANHTMLKTTPLEEQIISDLGGGTSLNEQFQLYRQYERHVSDGGRDGEKKFDWLRAFTRGRKAMYVGFWSSDCFACLAELELFKRLHRAHRSSVMFVLVSLDEDEAKWRSALTRFNLFADGIIHYRVGAAAASVREWRVKNLPHFVLIARNGTVMAQDAPPPGSDQLTAVLPKASEP